MLTITGFLPSTIGRLTFRADRREVGLHQFPEMIFVEGQTHSHAGLEGLGEFHARGDVTEHVFDVDMGLAPTPRVHQVAHGQAEHGVVQGSGLREITIPAGPKCR